MEYIELIMELVPYVLSIIAIIAGFKKGKVTLTAEEIEAKAEAKKQKLVAKLEKKNHIPKVETVAETTTEVTTENITIF